MHFHHSIQCKRMPKECSCNLFKYIQFHIKHQVDYIRYCIYTYCQALRRLPLHTKMFVSQSVRAELKQFKQFSGSFRHCLPLSQGHFKPITQIPKKTFQGGSENFTKGVDLPTWSLKKSEPSCLNRVKWKPPILLFRCVFNEKGCITYMF